MQARFGVALLVIGVIAACDAESPVTGVQTIASRILKNPEWRRTMTRCPAELMTRRQDLTYLQARDCERANAWARCLDACEDGSGSSCYWLAYSMQNHGAPDAGEVLDQQACRLGVVSSCTNRAAGRVRAVNEKSCRYGADDPACASATKLRARIQAAMKR